MGNYTRVIIRSLFWGAALQNGPLVFGQSPHPNTGQPPGPPDTVSVPERSDLAQAAALLRQGKKEAIPVLRDLFQRSSDKLERQRLASLLLRFGERDERYVSFLMLHARAAIEKPIPFPTKFDAEGRSVRGEYSAEFLRWCEQNRVDPENAAADALYSLPGDVAFLAEASDPRAYDLLLSGLRSPNHAVTARSAMGLAFLQDRRAIPEIDKAVARAPREAAEMIVRALVYFDDDTAQASARRMISDPVVFQEIKRIADADRNQRTKDRKLQASGN